MPLCNSLFWGRLTACCQIYNDRSRAYTWHVGRADCCKSDPDEGPSRTEEERERESVTRCFVQLENAVAKLMTSQLTILKEEVGYPDCKVRALKCDAVLFLGENVFFCPRAFIWPFTLHSRCKQISERR